MVKEAFEKLLVLFIIVASGYLLKKFRVVDEDDATLLIKVNTYTFLPALIFTVIYSSDFKIEHALIPAIGLSVMLVMTLISYIYGKFILKISENRFLMPFVVASSGGNTGYVGYPVCLALFGEKGLQLAVAFDIFATVLYALVIAAGLISYGAQKAENIKKLVLSVIKFPPTIAAVLALILKNIGLPLVLTNTLSFASQAAIPLTLLALGISLRDVVNIRYFKYAASTAILKLVLSPILGWVVAGWFLEGLPFKITVIQTGMPSLMLTYILSVRYETEPEFASFLVFSSTLLSIATIPVIVNFVA